MENQTTNSPLGKYLRQPKLYISLPSGGKWYAKNNISKADELEVYSMTANDEIGLKTPDGLLSGKVVTNLIKSCVPEIKDPWLIPMIDFEYILAAIRMASYGDSITTSGVCPKCSNSDSYAIDLQSVLQHIENAHFETVIKINDFTFNIRPLYYKESTELNKVSMMVQRAIKVTIPSIEDTEKREEHIEQLTEQINNATVDAVTSGIIEVITPDGDSETNPQFIKEFILNSDPIFYNKIQEAFKENTARMALPQSQVECSECGEKYQINTNLDYASFFGGG
jgi:hypothetical protein